MWCTTMFLRCDKTRVMRLNACFQHAGIQLQTEKVRATIPLARASERNSTGTHTEFPLTKVPDISITLSWMRDGGGRVTYRRITRRVCSLRDVFRVVRRIATIAKCNTRSRQLHLQRRNVHTSSESNASNRVLESRITRRAISPRNMTYCSPCYYNLYIERKSERERRIPRSMLSRIYLSTFHITNCNTLRRDFVVISNQNISNIMRIKLLRI